MPTYYDLWLSQRTSQPQGWEESHMMFLEWVALNHPALIKQLQDVED